MSVSVVLLRKPAHQGDLTTIETTIGTKMEVDKDRDKDRDDDVRRDGSWSSPCIGHAAAYQNALIFHCPDHCPDLRRSSSSSRSSSRSLSIRMDRARFPQPDIVQQKIPQQTRKRHFGPHTPIPTHSHTGGRVGAFNLRVKSPFTEVWISLATCGRPSACASSPGIVSAAR